MADLDLIPRRGVLTFQAEGNNEPGSPYYSRRVHHPSHASGVTIGRGYDMLKRKGSTVLEDLKQAGVPDQDAANLAKGAGLSGASADEFVARDAIKNIELTELAQKNLFESTYAQYQSQARRICSKPDVEKLYGACNWESMSVNTQDLIVDLLYRGDYSPGTRRMIQKALISNDPTVIKEAIGKLAGVPSDRRRRRASHLEKAIEKPLLLLP